MKAFQMSRNLLVLACLLSVGLFHPVQNLQAQSIDELLQSRGLSFEQVQRMAQNAGIDPNNPDELAAFARQNGVPESQIQLYLVQLRQLENEGLESTSVTDFTETVVASEDIQEQPIPTQASNPTSPTTNPQDQGLTYFGYNIFSGGPDSFQPSTPSPVDEGYIVGPDDELRLTVWGATEFQYELRVDIEGRTNIPNIGLITVAGKTLKELRTSLKLRLAQSYAGLVKTPPTIFMDLTVTRYKPIEIFVLGEVSSPGAYTVTSNATLFNVLYAVGGPTTAGSLRDIRIIRDGRVLRALDFYDLLLDGVLTENIPLLNNDRIFIPPRNNEIRIQGPVKRPAIYELKDGEDFQDLLRFTAGLQPEIYTDRFQINRIIPMAERSDASRAREILDFNLNDVLTGNIPITLVDGDRIQLFSITDINDQVVEINGAVDQPGTFELNQELQTIRDLILAADGLSENAYLGQAELIRTNDDLTQSYFNVNLAEAISGNEAENIMLQRRDLLTIYTLNDIRQIGLVSVVGYIRNPASYPWRENLRVYDLLFKAGGLFDAEYLEQVHLDRADLIRRNIDGRTTEVISFNLEEALQEEGFGLETLQPYDNIRIYPNTVQLIADKFVIIEGAVKNPGRYTYDEGMSLEDLLLKAQGFNENAFIGRVEVTRIEEPINDQQKAKPIIHNLINNSAEQFQFYSNDLFWSLMDKAAQFNLKHMDRVHVRINPNFEFQQTVLVNGEVEFPGSYAILSSNESLRSVIERAGGLTDEAYSKGSSVIRDSVKVIIDFEDNLMSGNNNFLIQAGDQINIPKKPRVVLITGNTVMNGFIEYEPGKRIKYYMDRAGGLQPNTSKYLQLTQANGAVFRVKRKGLFKNNPVVDEGAIIRAIFEQEPEREPFDLREIIVELTGITTSALTLYFLIDRITTQ
tara:strand:- start:2408 stop:5152 length:2745 start_codon:yes stop_codon:yes gene_type:complete